MGKTRKKDRRGNKRPGSADKTLSRANRRAKERLSGRIKAYEEGTKVGGYIKGETTKPGAMDRY